MTSLTWNAIASKSKFTAAGCGREIFKGRTRFVGLLAKFLSQDFLSFRSTLTVSMHIFSGSKGLWLTSLWSMFEGEATYFTELLNTSSMIWEFRTRTGSLNR
jgi:hypothetical protein